MATATLIEPRSIQPPVQQRTTPEPSTEDLYPHDPAEYGKLVDWCQKAFVAADTAREPYRIRWLRYYRLYRSWIRRPKGDWRSKVFYPISFWVVEVITPRLVAQLPHFLCLPVGPEDRQPAQTMEELLEWASSNSDLFLELVKATKSSLKYGTGIVKTFWRRDIRNARKLVPLMKPVTVNMPQPVLDPLTGQALTDPDGQPIVESKEVLLGSIPAGMRSERYSYVGYDGPAAECVDIFNFWTAPEATDVQSARYVIHRTYRDWDYIRRRVKEGIYTLPPGMNDGDISPLTNEPSSQRLYAVELGGGQQQDATRQPVELLEYWTNDGRVITFANRSHIIRVARNPFDHGEKPFARVVDHLVEHEFWGIGELESLEGLQDLQNALVNSRIDNIRMVMQAMFAVDPNQLVDLRDLQLKPGGVIRTTGGTDPSKVLHRIDLGDVTPSAFAEAQQTENTIEKVSGVTAYEIGQDTPSLNKTATGIGLLQEAAGGRFGLKSRLQELMGLRDVARQWGSLLQQFTTIPKVLRMLGPQGVIAFQTYSPESLQGAFDFDIETASSTLTQSRRRQEAMTLLQVLGSVAPITVPALIEDVLTAFDKKDLNRYLNPAAELGQSAGPLAPLGMEGQEQPGIQPPGLSPPGQPSLQPPPPGMPVMPPGQGSGFLPIPPPRISERISFPGGLPSTPWR